MPRRLHAVVLASVVAAAGCATGRSFRCPADGGAAWREIATDHFVLRTDLDRPRAAALLLKLERQRAEVVAALFPEARTPPGRVEVVAFRTRDEYRALAPPGVDAYYLRSSGGPPRVVLSGEMAPSQQALLSHELAHHFLAGVFLRQPRWLAEGLAVYAESVASDPGTGALVVGRPPPDRLARVLRDPTPAGEVLGWRGPPGPDALSRYATSWALVHLLLHRRPEAFAAYQARLARGEDPDAAWRAELPEWDPATPGALAALDRTLAAYVRGPLEGAPHPAPPGADLVGSEQLMPSVEVHALRLALWSHGPEQGQAALRAEVAEALREDPDHPVALQVEAELAHADARPFARAAVRAHPDDPRAWTFLGSALDAASEQAEREAAYRRAADLAPDNAAALVNLVRALLAGGRSGEALPHARRAAALAPWSPPVLDAYAATLSDLGRCAEAIPIQQRALEVLPEGTAERAFRSFRDRLAGYAEQCRLALAPGASAPPERVERAPEVGGQRRDERDPRPGARVIER